MKSRTKMIVMENLPITQDRIELDTLVSNVFSDMKTLNKPTSLYDLFQIVKGLHEEQDLFIFNNGTVAATRKGIVKYEEC